MIDAANPAMPSTSSGTRRTNALASGCLLDEYRIDTTAALPHMVRVEEPARQPAPAFHA